MKELFFIMMDRVAGDCVVTDDLTDWPGYRVVEEFVGTEEEAIERSLPCVDEANRLNTRG